MIIVQCTYNSPVQVDDFPEDCERSVKGALHFHPASVKELTAAELKHIQGKHKTLAAALLLVGEPQAKVKAEEPKTEAVAQPAAEEKPKAKDKGK